MTAPEETASLDSFWDHNEGQRMKISSRDGIFRKFILLITRESLISGVLPIDGQPATQVVVV